MCRNSSSVGCPAIRSQMRSPARQVVSASCPRTNALIVRVRMGQECRACCVGKCRLFHRTALPLLSGSISRAQALRCTVVVGRWVFTLVIANLGSRAVEEDKLGNANAVHGVEKLVTNHRAQAPLRLEKAEKPGIQRQLGRRELSDALIGRKGLVERGVPRANRCQLRSKTVTVLDRLVRALTKERRHRVCRVA